MLAGCSAAPISGGANKHGSKKPGLGVEAAYPSDSVEESVASMRKFSDYSGKLTQGEISRKNLRSLMEERRMSENYFYLEEVPHDNLLGRTE